MTQARLVEGGRSQVDGGGGVEPIGVGSEVSSTQVGVGQVGPTEVDDGVKEATVGGERRATQVGAGEAGSLQLDRICSYERGVLEVAVRRSGLHRRGWAWLDRRCAWYVPGSAG